MDLNINAATQRTINVCARIAHKTPEQFVEDLVRTEVGAYNELLREAFSQPTSEVPGQRVRVQRTRRRTNGLGPRSIPAEKVLKIASYIKSHDGESMKEVAKRFRISEPTAYKIRNGDHAALR